MRVPTSMLRRFARHLFLPTTRRLFAFPRPRLLGGVIAVAYAMVSLWLGGMFTPLTAGSGYSLQFVPANLAPSRWVYPVLEMVTPSAIITLPVLQTVLMALVSVGVGLGMGGGLLTAVLLVHRRPEKWGGSAAANGFSGLTPALLALVTLGACCSTTTAATAGIWVFGSGPGSDPWVLGVVQLVVLGIALLAQEGILATFGAVLGLVPDPYPTDGHLVAERISPPS